MSNDDLLDALEILFPGFAPIEAGAAPKTAPPNTPAPPHLKEETDARRS